MCFVLQGLGGQGIFIFVYFVGVGFGKVSFFYEVYLVKDVFMVILGGSELFFIGGFVFGNQMVEFDIMKVGFVIVFVSVSVF